MQFVLLVCTQVSNLHLGDENPLQLSVLPNNLVS